MKLISQIHLTNYIKFPLFITPDEGFVILLTQFRVLIYRCHDLKENYKYYLPFSNSALDPIDRMVQWYFLFLLLLSFIHDLLLLPVFFYQKICNHYKLASKSYTLPDKHGHTFSDHENLHIGLKEQHLQLNLDLQEILNRNLLILV